MNEKATILDEYDITKFVDNVKSTEKSFIHWLFPMRKNSSTKGRDYEILGLPRTYILVGITAILPLIILIFSAFHSDTLFSKYQMGLKLPFILDLNTIFTFLISFPTILILLVIDDKQLSDALKQLLEQGILRFDSKQKNKIEGFLGYWSSNYIRINLFVQFLGVIVGVGVAYANCKIYTPKNLGFWIVSVTESNSSLNVAGWMYLGGIGLLYFFLTVYILRVFAHSVFLANIVKEENSTVHILFLHPDRCGGLSPVGKIGLLNQIPLSVFGVNIVFLILVSFKFLNIEYPLLDLIVFSIVAYSILGPLVFFAPLLAFRKVMRTKRDKILVNFARKSRKLENIEDELEHGLIAENDKDEKIIEDLHKIGKQVLDLPVWPFDTVTIRTFVTSYLIPFISAIASGVILHYLTK